MSYVWVLCGIGSMLVFGVVLEATTKWSRDGRIHRTLKAVGWIWWIGIVALILFALSGCTLQQIEGTQGRVREIGGLVAPLADAVAPGSGAAVKVATEIALGILALFAAWTAKTAHGRLSKDKRERRAREDERRSVVEKALASQIGRDTSSAGP